jgi:xanthine dehydrogenase accessory factor
MNDWLTALSSLEGPAILVTVAATRGSAPRESGARMLVTSERQFDTIGGGHLELCACNLAREMLASPGKEIQSERRLERLPLGPTLGQCCGGVVHLSFERIERGAHGIFDLLQQRSRDGLSSWRLVAVDSAAAPLLLDESGRCIAGAADMPFADIDFNAPCHIMRDRTGARWLVDPYRPYRSQLFLFGAGHVGAAIVRALSDLPCRITWIDEREEMFPARLPGNVTVEATDTPETLVGAAPERASFLVMTHSHALDQRLAEQILRRDDVGWFGLIGSRTKRIQFERRLRARGISPERLAAMTCPIGIAGITGKEPATIAVAVAAQLLQVWEAQQAIASNPAAQREQTG